MMTFPRSASAPSVRERPPGGSGIQVWELVRVALQALASNKLRSFLTMLGIIIGVAAVITMIAIAQGASKSTQEQIAKLGTNVLTIYPSSQRTGAIQGGLGSSQTLTMDDCDAIAKQIPDVL